MQETVRAKISRAYLGKFGVIALACFGIALWFVYDGAIAYPAQRERALKYIELESEDRLDEWENMARERGWPVEPPGEPKEELDFFVQFVMAGIVLLPGLICSALFLLHLGRWIELEEGRIRTSSGKSFELGEIVRLDKKKWREKGIARITYQNGRRTSRVVLDDWKYDTEPTKEILRAIESQIPVDRIVGGAPEPVAAE